jgi:DNA-binding transcriptional ArsR family regulator
MMASSMKDPAREKDAVDLDRTLRALADGNRRAILALVTHGPRAVGEIAVETDLSQQTASHHLRILREAGLVNEVRDKTRHLFAVRTDGFTAASNYLDHFWPEQLASLKRAVENASGGTGDG